MVRKVACLFMLSFIFTTAMVSRTTSAVAEPTTWLVDDDGPADFQRIQDALNAASSGDTVLVKAGTYHERLSVSTPISLLGENRDTTIVDGTGVGTAVQISVNGVILANFTIRNAGETWGPPPGQGTPSSSITVNGVSNVQIENSILLDAAVGVWISYSSFVNVTDNSVVGAVYGGIIGYASSHLTISRNLVDNCGLMGIHLDGFSNNCTILDNMMMNNVEGLELESGSAANWIEQNIFVNDNASVVLNKCGSSNVFRRNSVTNSLYGLLVVGYNLESFLQDIDPSNIVNNKSVYYLTNLHDRSISRFDCPNPGSLAIINGTNIKIEDLDLYGGDNVLVAYSHGCTFTNITVGGNRGPLLWGGFTFYSSNNNTAVGCQVIGNSYAVTFYRSEGNVFHHNYFMDNERQVMSDFLTPFSTTSSGYVSENVWDDGAEGNYWSDYEGADANLDGVGDTPYVIDTINIDHYPLNAPLAKLDTEPPSIYIVAPIPGHDVSSSDVTLVWRGLDDASGVSYYEIRIDGSAWTNVGLNSTYPLVGLSEGRHTVDIRAYDVAGNIRHETVEFYVSTGGGGVQVPSYLDEVAIAAIVIVVAGIAIYLMKGKVVLKKRTASRLIR